MSSQPLVASRQFREACDRLGLVSVERCFSARKQLFYQRGGRCVASRRQIEQRELIAVRDRLWMVRAQRLLLDRERTPPIG